MHKGSFLTASAPPGPLIQSSLQSHCKAREWLTVPLPPLPLGLFLLLPRFCVSLALAAGIKLAGMMAGMRQHCLCGVGEQLMTGFLGFQLVPAAAPPSRECVLQQEHQAELSAG